MLWGRARREAGEAKAVVREAERVLAGRTLESFISRRERVPAWSLISLLAHGSRLDLIRLGSSAGRPDPAGWSGTVARLARDLIAITFDDPSLVRLQRRTMIPLELRLLGGTASPPTTPGELYSLVSGSLDRPLSPEF